jgi:prepilin-type N-terminal cleavage/methylation domain-containing protein
VSACRDATNARVAAQRENCGSRQPRLANVRLGEAAMNARSIRHLKDEKGFSLIELLIVVSVTGLIASAITTAFAVTVRSRDSIQSAIPPHPPQTLSICG